MSTPSPSGDSNVGSGLELGRTIDGRYAIIRELGRGGMGAVYEAEQIKLQKRVALKVLKADRALREDGGNSLKRFRREARVCSSIHHRNVVSIIDFGDLGDGSTYYVMELLRGKDLSSLIKTEGAMKWARAQWLLRQVLSGLGAAHDKGIIHRDVKPANIMLLEQTDEFGAEWVKVLDFGIAKEVNGTSQALTGTSELLGTAAYMAPEGVRGDLSDERADLYAVGVVAYQLLTGTLPFQGVNAFQVLVQHVNVPPRPPRELVPELPQVVESFVLRAMAKDPEHRYQSAEEMIDALDALGASPIDGLMAPEPPSLLASADVIGRLRRPSGATRASPQSNPIDPERYDGRPEISPSSPDAATAVLAMPLPRDPRELAPAWSWRRRPIVLGVGFGVPAAASILVAWLGIGPTVQPMRETNAPEPESSVATDGPADLDPASAAGGLPDRGEFVAGPGTEPVTSSSVVDDEFGSQSTTTRAESDEAAVVAATDALDTKITDAHKTIKRCESYACRQQREEKQLQRVVQRKCDSPSNEEVTVKLTIGTDGKALMPRALPPYEGSVLGKCVVEAVARASFPPPAKLVPKQLKLKL